jgi:D-beta-D-heptose 7-phosphate kinase/D-beta-D-heptose 1-phosphate adenosyltransferase
VENLWNLIERWRGQRVLVVGDVVLDAWFTGSAPRLGREAPVPVVDLDTPRYAAGAAGNLAANLAGLGARVRLLGVVGADPHGERLCRELVRHGVEPRLLTLPGRRTVTKRRVVAGGQIVARLDDGDTGPLARDVAESLCARLREELAAAPAAVVVLDSGAGTVVDPVRDCLAEARSRIPLLAVDSPDLPAWQRLRPDLVAPSVEQVARLLEVEVAADRDQWARQQLRRLSEITGARLAALTLDVDGCLVTDGGAAPLCRTRPVRPVPDSHATGAGDSFLAGFTLALLAGASPQQAANLAQTCADVVLDAPGTAVASCARLAAQTRGVVGVDTLVAAVGEARARGERIVFTNGCFDVLHRGHVGYLQEARELGDLLIVAVNGDESVRRLKGPDRPVNPVADRAAVLAALSCVDYVVAFDTDSPRSLLRQVNPDIYVKGGDYPPEVIPEAPLVRELGGEVRVLSYLPDRSTSAVIERIRNRADHHPGRKLSVAHQAGGSL